MFLQLLQCYLENRGAVASGNKNGCVVQNNGMDERGATTSG